MAKRAEGIEPLPERDEQRPVSKQWAVWIKKVYDVNPMLCPKCGETMRVKAFIHDPREIARFTKHLGFPAWRAPPPLGKGVHSESA